MCATEWALITLNFIRSKSKDFNVSFCIYFAYILGRLFFVAEVPQQYWIVVVGVTEPETIDHNKLDADERSIIINERPINGHFYEK